MPNMHETLSWSPASHNLDVVAEHPCNVTTWVEAGGSEAQGYLQLHSQTKTHKLGLKQNLNYP